MNKISLRIRQKANYILIAILLLLMANIYFVITMNRSVDKTDYEIYEIFETLLKNLQEMKENQIEMAKTMALWLEGEDSQEKQRLKDYLNDAYQNNRIAIGNQLVGLEEGDIVKQIKSTFSRIEVAMDLIDETMEMLTTKADFEDADKLNYCKNLYSQSYRPLYVSINEELDGIISDMNTFIKEKKSVSEKKNKIGNYFSMGISIIIAFLLFLLILGFSKVKKRIDGIYNSLSVLAQGDRSHTLEIKDMDEIGLVEDNVNKLSNGLENVKSFIQEIGKGNFKVKTQKIEKWGSFGAALLEMKNSLEDIENKQEKQRKEEEIRNWMAAGMAHFNEILRIKNENIDDLAYNLVKELVKYTKSVIGGVYIKRENKEGIEKLIMSGLFAYDRKRFVETELEFDEGLVGTVFMERHKIHMRELPNDYITVSSGLGAAPPRELLIVPLSINDEIFGVMELATLESYDETTIEFIERIAEALASTVSSVILNMETSRLLKESNEKAEQLHAQEEELRQNMEELQAAQEERERQAIQVVASQKNLEDILLNMPFPVYVKDEQKKYLMVNAEEEKLMGKTMKELIGKDDSVFIENADDLKEIEESDDKILKGAKRVELPEQKITLHDGSVKKLKTVKVPVLNNISCQINILGISYYL